VLGASPRGRFAGHRLLVQVRQYGLERPPSSAGFRTGSSLRSSVALGAFHLPLWFLRAARPERGCQGVNKSLEKEASAALGGPPRYARIARLGSRKSWDQAAPAGAPRRRPPGALAAHAAARGHGHGAIRTQRSRSRETAKTGGRARHGPGRLCARPCVFPPAPQG
jgi:hypothetical protein